MNDYFHGWLNSGPLQDDFIPIEHMPIGPSIGSPFLLSPGVVGVSVEVVPLFDSAVLLIAGLSEVLCSLSLSLPLVALPLSLFLLLLLLLSCLGSYHNRGHCCYYSRCNQQSKHQNYKRSIHDSISFTTIKGCFYYLV